MKSIQGKIASFYGRSFTVTKQNGHYYLKNRTGLYPNYPSREAQYLVLTESVIDVATLQQHVDLPKYTEVLACYGTNGFTKEHREAIKSLKKLQTIIVFFDGDETGRKASKKLHEILSIDFEEVNITIVKTPEDEDINSLWTNNESQELFKHLLKEVVSIK